MANQVDFEVDRRDHSKTRALVQDQPELADGQVRFAIDRFALTANNITYALVGDMLDYWGFFPAESPWGRIPAMGWANVVESKHADIPVGGRYFGWYPMSSHVVVQAAPSATGLTDDSPHRAKHAPIYRAFQDSARDPFYDSEHEDRHALLRGLFITAFLADDFLYDQEFFGSGRTIVLSASSKTAIGFAMQAHQRDRETIGVTSPGNVDMVRSLGFYDQVITYGAVDDLDTATGAALVDMSGNMEVVRRVHERLGSQLSYSMGIGMSHGAAGRAGDAARELPGPAQELFFAPSQVEKRLRDWGPKVYGQRVAEALKRFVESSTSWLEIEHAHGGEELAEIYRALLEGRLSPSRGQIVSLR